MSLKLWEAVLPPIFWGIAIVSLVSAGVGFVAGAARTVANISKHDIREAADSIAVTVLMGALAALMTMLIRDTIVLL